MLRQVRREICWHRRADLTTNRHAFDEHQLVLRRRHRKILKSGMQQRGVHFEKQHAVGARLAERLVPGKPDIVMAPSARRQHAASHVTVLPGHEPIDVGARPRSRVAVQRRCQRETLERNGMHALAVQQSPRFRRRHHLHVPARRDRDVDLPPRDRRLRRRAALDQRPRSHPRQRSATLANRQTEQRSPLRRRKLRITS